MDIKAAKFEALKGMAKLLAEHRPNVVCELTGKFLEEMGSSCETMLRLMEGHGYHTRRTCDVPPGESHELSSDDPATWLTRQVDLVFTPRTACA